MSGENISKVQRVLLALVSKSMFGTPLDPQELRSLTSEELDELYRESVYQAVTAVAFDGIDTPKEILGEKLYKRWLSTSRANILNTQRVWENHALVAKRLEEAGIPYTILKGCASAYYYRKKHLRTMGDVDFLVHEEDLDAAIAAFDSFGWKVNSEHKNHIVLFKSEKEHIELRYEPPGIPYGRSCENTIRSITDHIIETSEKVEFEGFESYIPDTLHQFFVLVLHTYHHLALEGVGLRHICDLAAFFNECVTEEAWNEKLAPKLKECGIYVLACNLLSIAEKYLSMPDKKIIFAADEGLCYEVLSDIFKGGNFGFKDQARVGTGGFVKAIVRNEEDGSFVSTAVTVKNIAVKRFPASEKYPVILPFAIIATVVRFAYRRITGKHKNRGTIVGNMSVITRRQAMLKKLKLFEVER